MKTRREIEVTLERAGAALAHRLRYPSMPDDTQDLLRAWDLAHGEWQQIEHLTGTRTEVPSNSQVPTVCTCGEPRAEGVMHRTRGPCLANAAVAGMERAGEIQHWVTELQATALARPEPASTPVAVESIDTPEFVEILNSWHFANFGEASHIARLELVAHIKAHVSAQVAKAGVNDCRKYCQREADEAKTNQEPVGAPDIKEMVNRFLGWKLPNRFNPDNGIVFHKPDHLEFWPIGTNLFTADQATAMFEHCLTQAAPQGQQSAAPGDFAERAIDGFMMLRKKKHYGPLEYARANDDATLAAKADPAQEAGVRWTLADRDEADELAREHRSGAQDQLMFVDGYLAACTKWRSKTASAQPAVDLVAAKPQIVMLPPDPDTPIYVLLAQIEGMLANYERYGAACTFESQPMIYASTLEEIAEQVNLARAQLEGK